MLKKLTITLLMILALIVPLAGDEEELDIDAQKGHSFFQNEDYYSALVFYARTLENGSADGIVWYRTAYCFEQQSGMDDFTSRLYTISFYYLVQQNPDHPYTEELKSKIDQSIKINNILIRRTRGEIADRIIQPGENPNRRGLFGKIRDFFETWFDFFRIETKEKVKSVERVGRQFSSYGFAAGLRSVYKNLGLLLSIWFLGSFFTGVLLPFTIIKMDQKKGKQKNLFVAYLLWLHWGVFGIHRLYLGQLGMGFLWFITLGGLGIGWLADGILLPMHFKKAGVGRSTSGRSASSRNRPSLKRKAEQYRASSSGSGLDEMDLLTET